MALDTLTSMTVFRQIAERGSLAAAARVTGLSAEMAGHHLRSLETRLGVRLVNRTTRRLNLTDAGRSYYRRCVAVLDEIALAEAEAGQQQAVAKGHIKIAAPLAFATSMLAEPIAAFSERHPQVSVEIDLSERNVGLVEEGYDLALRIGDLADSGLIIRRIATFPLILVAAPGYLERHPAPMHPTDIADHDVLIYTQTGNPRLWQFTGADGARVDVAVSGRLSASDIEFLMRLALQGHGLLQVPAFLLKDHLAEGNLVSLLGEWQTRLLPLHVVLPHRTLLPVAVRSFSDFLAGWFDGSRETR
ncbi:MAG: LysR family transcriptional regulator [Rhizobiaceae bacterium]|nr:LysR family transcriptional regulator [Rhizobiaceae bacterium]